MDFYSKTYDTTNINPFIHYLKFGLVEGNIPKLFSLKELKSKNLKLTLKGKNNYYFLINDGNNELLQHFDEDYQHEFNPISFSKDYFFKKKLFNQHNIEYAYFVVPDKSIVCKDYLPFTWNNIYRNLDKIEGIPNFTDELNPSDFFPYDTHMNFEGGKTFSYNIIHHLNPSITKKDFENIISENGQILVGKSGEDLLSDINWSYSNKYKENLKRNKCVYLISKNSHSLHEKIPNEFKLCHNRKSLHYFNPNAYSDLKVLIFHDSTIISIYNYLTLYFKEIFLYWDHGTINKELIKWYEPNLILEIRVERFLEKLIVPDWVKNRENIFRTNE